MYEDTLEQVLDDMLKAIKQLPSAGFIVNLYKSQLAQSMVQVFRHLQSLGGFWASKVPKLTNFIEKNSW